MGVQSPHRECRDYRADSVGTGILLAGGTGSRIGPSCPPLNKHLLPVYSKPMIYYSLSSLMQLNCRRIIVVTSPESRCHLETLLGDGSEYGTDVTFASQQSPTGVVGAIRAALGEASGLDEAWVMLGDNIFTSDLGTLPRGNDHGEERRSVALSTVVSDGSQFGVVLRDGRGTVRSLVEKPLIGQAEVLTGLYLLDSEGLAAVGEVGVGPRGELEVTDLLSLLLERDALDIRPIPANANWFDAGSAQALYAASAHVAALEMRTGHPVGSPHAIALNRGWISEKTFQIVCDRFASSLYGGLIAGRRVRNNVT